MLELILSIILIPFALGSLVLTGAVIAAMCKGSKKN